MEQVEQQREHDQTQANIVSMLEGVYNRNNSTALHLEEYVENPSNLKNISPAQLFQSLIEEGYEVKPLGKGNWAGIPFEEGGGFRVNWGGDRILQYHPAGRSHHGGAYYKISSGKTGTIRIYLDSSE